MKPCLGVGAAVWEKLAAGIRGAELHAAGVHVLVFGIAWVEVLQIGSLLTLELEL